MSSKNISKNFIGFKVSESEKEYLQVVAQKNNVNLSMLIRYLIFGRLNKLVKN